MDSTVAGVVNPTRNYSRLSDALDEVLRARIYGGMHYRRSTRIGAKVGKEVSRFTTEGFAPVISPERRRYVAVDDVDALLPAFAGAVQFDDVVSRGEWAE